MAVNITSRESLQKFRAELITHIAEGLPVEDELAIVERSLLRVAIPAVVTCTTCYGSGWEHITHRIRSRYVDSAVRCTRCDGHGSVEV